MIKEKIFECFDEYVEKRHDEMGSDYTAPEVSDMLDQAHEPLMEYYREQEDEYCTLVAELRTWEKEISMIRQYFDERYDEKLREIRENIVDRRERYRTEQSLMPGKI